MKKILVFTHYFYPSENGGGPVASLINFVTRMSHEFDISIVTSSIDLNANKEYSTVSTDSWNSYNGASVMYVNPKDLSIDFIVSILKSEKYDYVYLNSLFDTKFTIYPLLARMQLQNRSKRTSEFVIAPRGELSPGALGIKKNKKSIYLNFAKTVGLYNNVIWNASTEMEKRDIEKIFPDALDIRIAKDLTADTSSITYMKKEKEMTVKKFIFLSRISPKKNLYSALEFYSKTQGVSEFHIYGPLEDGDYWKKCFELIESMPVNKHVQYMGTVKHDNVVETFAKYDFFLFPTLGENYGHVIIESLLAGTPVILSDTTPWNMLEENNSGWNISLDDESRFIETIQSCIYMDSTVYSNMSYSSYLYAKKVTSGDEILDEYRLLFK